MKKGISIIINDVKHELIITGNGGKSDCDICSLSYICNKKRPICVALTEDTYYCFQKSK